VSDWRYGLVKDLVPDLEPSCQARSVTKTGSYFLTTPMDTTAALDSLRAFRADAYACFRYRADALFELTDALLTTGPALLLAHLSLVQAPCRGWGSAYAALAYGRMTRRASSWHATCSPTGSRSTLST